MYFVLISDMSESLSQICVLLVMSIWRVHRTIVVSPIIAVCVWIHLSIHLPIYRLCVSARVLYKRASKCTRRIKWKSAKYAEKDHHKKYIYMDVFGVSYVLYTSAALCAIDHNGTAMLTSDADINTNQYICFFKSYFCSFDKITRTYSRTASRSIYI